MPTLRTKLATELNKIPGLDMKVIKGKHEGFTYFEYRGKEIAHFDNNNELDVRLTKSIIKQKQLIHPSDSKNHPNRSKTLPHWIVLQFKKSEQLKEIVQLVKLAMKQN